MADIAHQHGSAPVPVEHERPEDWGWHHEWRLAAPAVGWIATIALLLLIFGNHTGNVENYFLIGVAAFMALLLVLDRVRRKNAWRA